MTVVVDSEALAALRDGMERFRRAHYTFGQRSAWLGVAPGYSEAAWQTCATLGWLALPLAAETGGLGDDPRATCVLMEHVGASLALEPVFGSAVLCGRVLARVGGDEALQRQQDIAAGRHRYALAHAEAADAAASLRVDTVLRDGRLHGRKLLALHGDVADVLIISARCAEEGRLALCCVDPQAEGVTATRYRLLDGRGAASFGFDAVPAQALGTAEDVAPMLERALDDARLALCAETLGAVRALNELSLEHLRTRRQFGRAIGTQQVLQHRMVDLHILQEELQAVIEAAQRAGAAPEPVRRRAISGAAAHAATVGRSAAHEAVQMHGGMGMTDELAVSHYFKRLMVTARLLGDREYHLERFSAASHAHD